MQQSKLTRSQMWDLLTLARAAALNEGNPVRKADFQETVAALEADLAEGFGKDPQG